MSRLGQIRERNSRMSPRSQKVAGVIIWLVLFVLVTVIADHVHGTGRVVLVLAAVVLVGLGAAFIRSRPGRWRS